MPIAPISFELWEAFVAERQHWEIVTIEPNFIATDRKRYIQGDMFNNPMDVSFTSEVCATREAAAYFIGATAMQAALTKVGILHVDA